MTQIPPVQPPVQPVVDPINEKINKLSKTAIDRVWEEKVTNVDWNWKLPGAIQYLFTKIVYTFGIGETAEADKKFGATIAKFNKASEELVEAVANRYLTPEETNTLGENNCPSVQFISPDKQMEYANCLQISEDKLKEFYDLFRERITQEGDTDENSFGAYAAAAQKIITDLSQSKKLHDRMNWPALLPVRIQTTLNNFNGKIFKDMVAAYADQPIANITIDSFKAKVALIKGFFTDVNTVDIEASLRKAIKDKHDTAAINKIRDEFIKPGPDLDRHLKAAIGTIKTRLTKEQKELQKELDELRGDKGDNGKVDAAWKERKTAEDAMNEAKVVYIEKRGTFGSAAKAETPIAELLALEDTDPHIVEAKVDLVAKAKVFDEKKKAHEVLDARFNEIAHYQQGTQNRDGGKLFKVEANLQPAALEGAATDETTKVASFYDALNTVVEENNKVELSQALHAIIDPPRTP